MTFWTGCGLSIWTSSRQELPATSTDRQGFSLWILGLSCLNSFRPCALIDNSASTHYQHILCFSNISRGDFSLQRNYWSRSRHHRNQLSPLSVLRGYCNTLPTLMLGQQLKWTWIWTRWPIIQILTFRPLPCPLLVLLALCYLNFSLLGLGERILLWRLFWNLWKGWNWRRNST